jgi:hypothetical protein
MGLTFADTLWASGPPHLEMGLGSGLVYPWDSQSGFPRAQPLICSMATSTWLSLEARFCFRATRSFFCLPTLACRECGWRGPALSSVGKDKLWVCK